MTKDNEDALGLACEHGQLARACYVCELEGQIQAKDALLRQAVEVAESQCEYELVAAIRQHLEGRA